MTAQAGSEDVLAQLERDVRKIIDDNKRFLARLMDDGNGLTADEQPEE